VPNDRRGLVPTRELLQSGLQLGSPKLMSLGKNLHQLARMLGFTSTRTNTSRTRMEPVPIARIASYEA